MSFPSEVVRGRVAWLALLAVSASLGVPAFADGTTIRVNCGGPAFTDSHGNAWSADYGYSEGGTWTFTDPFSGPDQNPYMTSRYDDYGHAGNLKYSFPVANGWYKVRLHFGGVGSVGDRTQGVAVEGVVAIRSMDVIAEAGVNNPLVKEILTEVKDGQIDIEFLPGSGYSPLVNGIEVLPSEAPTTFAPIRVNSGGPAFTDSHGNAWSADYGYNEGGTWQFSAPFVGTDD